MYNLQCFKFFLSLKLISFYVFYKLYAEIGQLLKKLAPIVCLSLLFSTLLDMYKCMPSAFFPFSIRYHDVFTLLYFHMYSISFNMIFLVVCSQRQTETSTLPLDVSLCLCKHTSRDEFAFYSSNFHLLHFSSFLLRGRYLSENE